MIERALPLLLVFFAACGPDFVAPEPSPVERRTDGIVGGRASFGDPEVFVLWMQYGNGAAICSSTLIAPHTLLTAAHCVADLPTRVRATNQPSLDQADPADFIGARSYHSHPSFRETGTDIIYDVAAVNLVREPFAPLKQWNKDPVDSINRQQVRVVGYGLTSSTLDVDDSGFKRSGISKMLSFDDQHLSLGKEGANASGTCQGDSGGPALHTYPDGVERVVGVTSYGGSTCGPGVDARVDRFQQIIGQWVDEFEHGTCAQDQRCREGCMPADPDCACLEDGQCNMSCTADPDCPESCGADGVCSKQPCASPDPDCQAPGGTCGRDGHCNSRLCITSPQHDVPYCSVACSATVACPAGFTCNASAGRCELTPLPVAAPMEPCTPGGTYCGGPQYACSTWAKDSTPRCMRRCFESADCDPGWSCTVGITSGQVGVCVENIVLARLAQEPLKATGCTAAPGSLGLTLAGLALVRRRRAQPRS